MKNRKAQAALEFLMTYGWAFLVILVMIGALAYFGVLSPKNLMPEKCTTTTGFSCDEFQATAGTSNNATMVLMNTIGTSITPNGIVTCTSDYTMTASATTSPVSNGDLFRVDASFSGTEKPDSGEKIEANCAIEYMATGKSLTKTIQVDLFVLVQ